MLVHVIMTIARQVDGDMVFIISEDRGSTNREKAIALRDEAKKKYVDANGKAKVVQIQTPQGEANCCCEIGIFDVEIDEGE